MTTTLPPDDTLDPNPPDAPEEKIVAQTPTPPLPPTPETAPPTAPEINATRASSEKSPALAAVLAFVPFGLGHLYLGLYHRAVLFFVAFWFSMLVLQMPLIAVFFYFFTIFDAFRQAQLINLEEDGEHKASRGGGALSLGVFLVVVGAVLLLDNWVDLDDIQEFLQDYSPAILVLIGIYLIFQATRDRAREVEEDSDEGHGSD